MPQCVHQLPFGTFKFFKDYIVGQPAEGSHMGVSEVKAMADLARQHYPHPFFYVGNRLYRNSVDPHAINTIKDELPQLVAVAIVYYFPSTKQVLELESRIVQNLPFATFHDLKHAIEWGQQQLLSTNG